MLFFAVRFFFVFSGMSTSHAPGERREILGHLGLKVCLGPRSGKGEDTRHQRKVSFTGAELSNNPVFGAGIKSSCLGTIKADSGCGTQ